jgi:zinc/manganese transport system permease protein
MSPDFTAIDWSVLGPAFAAGLLVLATHVPLGIEVLRRGIIFIDLAIAQIAALGVISANLLGWEGDSLAVQVCAALAALAGALVLTLAERLWPEMLEALIGLSFVLAASLGILLLAGNPHGGEHLKDLLAGQILWVSPRQLIVAATVAAVVLSLWFGRGARLGRGGFYLLFSITVTISVQLVGVYLVFASLIAPAVATRGAGSGVAPWRRLAGGYALGAAGYAIGLMLSAYFDLPSGAAIVCAMCALALAAIVLGSGRSLKFAATQRE